MQGTANGSGHPDLTRILQDLDTNEAGVRQILAGLTESQLNWQPAPGQSWSIAQCLEHLSLANAEYTAAMRSVLAKSGKRKLPRKGPIQPSGLGQLFLKKLEPPVLRKAPAPKKIVPTGAQNSAGVHAAFLGSHDQIRAIINDAADLDLNRIKFRNPLFPLLRVRAGTGLLIMAAHERRHLWQANRIRTKLEASGQTTT